MYKNNVEHQCYFCSNPVDPVDDYIVNDVWVCTSCYDSQVYTCTECNEEVFSDSIHVDDERDLAVCDICYDSYYTRCYSCNVMLHTNEAYYSDDSSDDYYDEPLCYNCYSSHVTYIHTYEFKPEPEFKGRGLRYFGVELEIDKGGSDVSTARTILSVANKDAENMYIKKDSSLSFGMELVTHPMSLNYHKRSMPWKNVLAKVISLGFSSHYTNTCGLHIHVNRDSLGSDLAEQDNNIGKILYFFECNWAELFKFSRRTVDQIKHWAYRYGWKEEPNDILKYAKASTSNRHTCVNVTNTNTVEFRIFKGTLKYRTLIASIQLVNEICNMVRKTSEEEIKITSWSQFVSKIDTHMNQELIQYLKSKQLYVNEKLI